MGEYATHNDLVDKFIRLLPDATIADFQKVSRVLFFLVDIRYLFINFLYPYMYLIKSYIFFMYVSMLNYYMQHNEKYM